MATVVAAEVHFAQRLAGNEKKTRDKAVKRLRKWLEIKSVSTKGLKFGCTLTHACQRSRSYIHRNWLWSAAYGNGGLSEEDLLKIWKGLHYCMWMSDKPLIQEELATSISSLIHCFQNNTSLVLSFIRVFFKTEAREWHGIDRWRVDKFMMLIRRFLNQSLVFLRNGGWAEDMVRQFTDIVSMEIVDVDGELNVPEGLKYHFVDIYLDELSKVGAEQLTGDQVVTFLKPFYSRLPLLKSRTVVKYIICHMFEKLLEQEVMRLKREVTPADAEQGEVTEEGTEDEEEAPRLQVNLEELADKLFEVAQAQTCLSRNRPVIYKLVNRLQKVTKGILPKDDVDTVEEDDPIKDRDISAAARRLERLDKHLYEQSCMSEIKKKKRVKLKGIIAEYKAQEKKKKRKENAQLTKNERSEMKKSSVRELSIPDIPQVSQTKDKSDISENSQVKEKCKSTKTQKLNVMTVECKQKKENHVSSKLEVHKTKGDLKRLKMKNESSKKVKDSIVTENGDEDVKPKKKRKSSNALVNPSSGVETNSNSVLEEEVEIWIPNKKYKGKLTGESPGQSTVQPAPASFAQFERGLKTPPAFVKRAFTKLRTPKTEPVKRKKKMAGRHSESHSALKKRVSFNMKRNTSLDFNDSINFSPELPFNPKMKPDQSILKSPVNVVGKSGSKLKARRLKAEDFF